MTQNEDHLPREVSRSALHINGYEIEVVHLDNGQRIITEEGMYKFMQYLTDKRLPNVPPESK